jgi:hypothetical protein
LQTTYNFYFRAYITGHVFTPNSDKLKIDMLNQAFSL